MDVKLDANHKRTLTIAGRLLAAHNQMSTAAAVSVIISRPTVLNAIVRFTVDELLPGEMTAEDFAKAASALKQILDEPLKSEPEDIPGMAAVIAADAAEREAETAPEPEPVESET